MERLEYGRDRRHVWKREPAQALSGDLSDAPERKSGPGWLSPKTLDRLQLWSRRPDDPLRRPPGQELSQEGNQIRLDITILAQLVQEGNGAMGEVVPVDLLLMVR